MGAERCIVREAGREAATSLRTACALGTLAGRRSWPPILWGVPRHPSEGDWLGAARAEGPGHLGENH